MLTRAEIMIVNDLISKIYRVDDFDEMRIRTLEEINDIIPYDTSSFYLASKTDEHILARPVGVGIEPSELQRYIDEFEDKDYTRWIFLSGNNIVYRESDLFPDSVREKHEYYRNIYINGHMYYSLQASVSTNGMFQGVISLYRDIDKEDFIDKELFMLELLVKHFGNRINMELEKKEQKEINSKAYNSRYELMERFDLTKREIEILGLLMAGLETSAISENLSISENTVKKHATSIYKKLGISSRWELIKFVN